MEIYLYWNTREQRYSQCHYLADRRYRFLDEQEGAMSYSKAGKARDFTPSTAPHRGWQASIHTALVGICFAFVAAVIFGLVP